MKKKVFNSKLNLKKETIANLNDDEMKNVKGGVILTFFCTTTLITKVCPYTMVACKLPTGGECQA